jgi:hypothetical protein
MTRHARLPEHRETATLDMLGVGEQCYTVPWAMWADEERRLWLHPHYSAYGQPGGTARMLVTRTADGYEVDIRSVHNHTWLPGPNMYAGAGSEPAWIPVCKVHH